MVKDIDEVIKTWQQIFDVEPFTIFDLSMPYADGKPMVIRRVNGRLGNLKIQLLQLIKGGPPSGAPAGLQHIGIYVDDLYFGLRSTK